jgi:hypothetical protein
MIRYECDKCGRRMRADDGRRYIVKIEIYAAAGHIDIDATQNDKDTSLQDILDELADADPDEIEDQTYRAFRFDLCDVCRKRLIGSPLG